LSLPRLTCFDLDHTLLSGDSDVFWCDYLIARGLLDKASFAARNADMETRYKAGTVGLEEFANFYVGTLAGRSLAFWEPVRQDFLRDCIIPNIPKAATDLVNAHRAAGDLVVLTTATNRYITELTARYFQIAHLIATEPQVENGVFTGCTSGPLNMREGKVARLQHWLGRRTQRLADFHSIAYSDSINDLPLLQAVNEAVAVDPDPRLLAAARQAGWQIMALPR
jgi:HAD superfamily hydrolase (TIGR01490 family)